jgi:hypothetical protein
MTRRINLLRYHPIASDASWHPGARNGYCGVNDNKGESLSWYADDFRAALWNQRSPKSLQILKSGRDSHNCGFLILCQVLLGQSHAVQGTSPEVLSANQCVRGRGFSWYTVRNRYAERFHQCGQAILSRLHAHFNNCRLICLLRS